MSAVKKCIFAVVYQVVTFLVFLRLNKKVNVIDYKYEKYTTDNLFSCTLTVVWTRLYVPAFKQAYFEDSTGN